MAETTTAGTPGRGGKGKAKSKKLKTPAVHPKYMEMSVAAINALKERNGSSRQAILKYIISHFNVGKDPKIVNTHLKMALKRGVASGVLRHAKGQGASGSFRVTEKTPVGVRKPRKIVKAKKVEPVEKVKVEKVKKPKAKAARVVKKKKEVKPKKEKKAKSPKKVVEKKKALKTKKPKTPKKAGEKKRVAAKPKRMKSPKKGKK